MSDRKSRFNLFGFNKRKNNLNWSDDSKNASFSDDEGNNLGFPSFDSIIPESSPLKKNSDSSSGFFNDDFKSKSNLNNSPHDDLEGVDEKYAKYINSVFRHYISNSGFDENGGFSGGEAGLAWALPSRPL